MSVRRTGAVLVAIMVSLAILGPWIAPYAPDAWIAAPFQPPSSSHWLGTDDMGQDLASAWLYGARHSVAIAVLAALGATLIGTLIGAGAGYRRGAWDFIAMRLVDFFLTLPTLPLMLVVAFYAGASTPLLIAVLIASSWARCAREVHPAAAALRDADFIVAERAMGATAGGILLRHVLPVLSPMILAQFARLTYHAVLLDSALCFLGLGDSREVSWGTTLYYANARAAFLGESWLWWVLPPGLGIAFLVTGFALLGVGQPRGAALRAAMVPHGPAPDPDPSQLLEIGDLHVGYAGSPILRGLDLQLAPGEVVGLVGLSGAGKTTLVQTILGLLPRAEISRGGVWLAGSELLRMPERLRRRKRGGDIAWISQAAMQSLNPVRTIGSQLREVARFDRRDVDIGAVLEQVGLSRELEDAYPHQLSGGMRQRVVIAMVLCRESRVLLADEPTSGLDSDRAREIVELLTRLCRERRMALLLVSHDLALIERHCDRLAILDEGRVVESGPATSLLAAPQSTVGRTLTASGGQTILSVVRRDRQDCPSSTVVLDIDAVDFAYTMRPVLENLSLQVHGGESVGLVGPSGEGKTTIARLALRLLRPARGTVTLLGRDLGSLRGSALRAHLRHAHLIFQDPFAALPWHQPVKTIVAEPLRLAGASREQRASAVARALAEAGLAESYAERNVDSLSGGERQRVALARALVAEPRLIIADEPTSMLDAPMKWSWLERLNTLRRERGLAVLLITHDQAQAAAFCDRVVTLGVTPPATLYSDARAPRAMRDADSRRSR